MTDNDTCGDSDETKLPRLHARNVRALSQRPLSGAPGRVKIALAVAPLLDCEGFDVDAPSQLRLTLVSGGGGPRGLFVTSEIIRDAGA